MTNSKMPTPEQQKVLWEWCGFKFVENIEHSQYFGDLDFSSWIYPDSGYRARDLPPIDLNNLFKYAVPKLQKGIDGWELFDIDFFLDGDWITARLLFVKDSKDGLPDNKSYINEGICTAPALALFRAIYKVIEDEE